MSGLKDLELWFNDEPPFCYRDTLVIVDDVDSQIIITLGHQISLKIVGQAANRCGGHEMITFDYR